MKKTDVVDVTIRVPQETRMVGDVTKIAYGDTAKSGVTGQKTGTVEAIPDPFGNTSVEPEDGIPAEGYIPSVLREDGMNVDGSNPFPPEISGSADSQPDMGTTPEAASVVTTPMGPGVYWPAGSDRVSAGGAADTDTLCMVTGSKQSFPPNSNNSAPVKDVMSFMPDGKDWK